MGVFGLWGGLVVGQRTCVRDSVGPSRHAAAGSIPLFLWVVHSGRSPTRSIVRVLGGSPPRIDRRCVCVPNDQLSLACPDCPGICPGTVGQPDDMRPAAPMDSAGRSLAPPGMIDYWPMESVCPVSGNPTSPYYITHPLLRSLSLLRVGVDIARLPGQICRLSQKNRVSGVRAVGGLPGQIPDRDGWSVGRATHIWFAGPRCRFIVPREPASAIVWPEEGQLVGRSGHTCPWSANRPAMLLTGRLHFLIAGMGIRADRLQHQHSSQAGPDGYSYARP